MRLLLPLLAACLPSPAAALTFVVDTSSDSSLSACTAAPGDCSLRGAIMAANADSGADTIAFAIPGDDPGFRPDTQHWRIAVGDQALPAIAAPVLIDGYTQPGASANTRSTAQGGLDSVLRIELRAAGASPAQQSGLAIGGDFNQPASTFRGLAIGGFGVQVFLAGGSAHAVEGCYLGTDILGLASADTQPNANSTGVRVQGPGAYRIGGTPPAARNLIAGLRNGIASFTASDGMRIEGNLIGTNAGGLQALGLRGDAIAIGSDWTNGRLGGSDPAARNVIAAAAFSALRLDAGGAGAYAGTRIEGNFIGTDALGRGALGNGLNPQSPSQPQPSVNASGFQCALAIGGSAPGQANLIANSGAAGIHVDACRGLSSPLNHFRGNRGVPIDNASGGAALGATTNDPGDADDGGNRLQNFPQLELPAGFAPGGGASANVGYRVDSGTANASYPLRVDFYRADCGGGSRSWLGSANIAAIDAQLPLQFMLSAPDGGNLLPLTALAVDAAGNSSEFAPPQGETIHAGAFEDTPAALPAGRCTPP